MKRIGFVLSIHLLLAVLVFSHLLINFQSFPNYSKQALNIRGIVSHVSVSALIGLRGLQEIRPLTIYGFTSPKALVVLENDLFPQSARAQTNGYFEIIDASIPINQREVCISSYDSFGRLTSPICIPLSDYSIDEDRRIGPVLLSPTVSADKGNYYIGDESIISGQTIPNTNVYISVYQDTKPRLSFANEVYAFSIPEIKTQSDKQGNYSVSFPTNHSSDYRVFIRTEYDENFSPKSNTLFIRIYPLYMYLIAFVRFVIGSIMTRLIEFLLVFEMLFFIIILVRHYFNPYHIARSRAITVYKPLLPIKESLLPIKPVKQVIPSGTK